MLTATHPNIGTVSSREESPRLQEETVVPKNARGIVMFVHGCGSSRHSPHDRTLAESLMARGYGAVLFDVLTPQEEALDLQTGEYRSDPGFISHRVLAATEQLARIYDPRELPIALMGVGAGAAAALVAAARRPSRFQAVICRSGFPDVAGSALSSVRSPTLLLVAEKDVEGTRSSRIAVNQLTCVHDLRSIAGASATFDEPGILDEVARLAADWLDRYLVPEPVNEPAIGSKYKQPSDICSCTTTSRA